MKRIWTPEQIELLERMWMGGNSTTHIAGMLGADISKNAVIGKARRLGLPTHIGWYGGSILKPAQARPQRLNAARGTIPGHQTFRAIQEPRIKPPAPHDITAYETDRRANGSVSFLDMRYHRQCKFFLQGESGCHGLVCAAPTDVTERYCEEHKAVSRASPRAFVEAAE